MTDNVNQSEYWESIYQNERPRWDIGHPTPVFENWLRQHPAAKGRIAVLGCGNGHDAVLFARHGFEVTAIDFAPTPIAHVRALAQAHRVNLQTLQEDIFKLPQTFKAYFDFVLEYTCFCAIDPARREEFTGVIREILKPGGRLIALFFPLDERLEGPPFTVRTEEIDRLFLRDFTLVHDVLPDDSVEKRKGKERFVILQKK